MPKSEVGLQNKEIFDLAEDGRRICLSLLETFNAEKVKLVDVLPHKRIFLIFLARLIKTYSAICTLCREGYGQDASPLLRSQLETLISAKYIVCRPAEADQKAVRFVEYKWVILKRYLTELITDFSDSEAGELLSKQEMINQKFQEFKQKFKVSSDRGLLTWSGKSIRDMAKLADKDLFKEYESAFRVDSRFSHPSIIGDKEYLDYKDDALVFSFLPSSSGVVLSLKRAMNYLADFLTLFNSLFQLKQEGMTDGFHLKLTEVFKMEKYVNALLFEKAAPALNKEAAQKMSVRFELGGRAAE